MNIVMSSVNYSTADLKERESISFTKKHMTDIYTRAMKNSDILGMVILSTCNRTEVYMSVKDESSVNPMRVLCECADKDYSRYEKICREKSGSDVIWYLSELACGIKSMIWGEDQIITQVKDALCFARENHATDNIIEVMFRKAVSAAKKVRTVTELSVGKDNSGIRAAELIGKIASSPKTLVIGNGMAGRSAARQLVMLGIDTTMTLRQYKHGEIAVPHGVKTVDYSQRYTALQSCGAVISATSSPHYTLEYDKLLTLEKLPDIFIDLAVPSDIDDRIALLDTVTYYNIDDIGKQYREDLHKKQYDEIRAVISRYVDDFYKWYNYANNKGDKGDE